MAEWHRFGCLDTWPCNCKQTSSLRFPIEYMNFGKRNIAAKLTASLFDTAVKILGARKRRRPTQSLIVSNDSLSTKIWYSILFLVVHRSQNSSVILCRILSIMKPTMRHYYAVCGIYSETSILTLQPTPICICNKTGDLCH